MATSRTSREKGRRGMRRLVVFWNLRISIRAFTPGRNRRFFVGVLPPAVVLPVGVFFPPVLLATGVLLLAAGVFLAEPAAAAGAVALLVPGLGDRD
jgi:hypothetical protein